MEKEGMDGGRGAWSYRDQTGSSSYSISSSYSGTLSTGYASIGSRLASMEAAMQLEEMEKDTEFVQPAKKSRKETAEKQHSGGSCRKEWENQLNTDSIVSTSHLSKGFGGDWEELISDQVDAPRSPPLLSNPGLIEQGPSRKETTKEKNEHIKILARRFFCAPPSANCSCSINVSVLDSWLSELGVGWVLHLAEGEKLELDMDDASIWIRALTEIMDTFCFAMSLFPGHSSVEGKERATEEKEEQDMTETDQVQFASFTQRAILKMLDFVDVIVSPNRACEILIDNRVPFPASYQKLHTLLRVSDTLSKALSEIQLLFHSSSPSLSAEVERILHEIVSVLSAMEGKAMHQIRTQLLEESTEDGGGSSPTQAPQESSAVQKVTRSVISYVRFLHTIYSSAVPIASVSGGAAASSLGNFPPHIGIGKNIQHLTSLLEDMMSRLEQTLAKKSEAFPDQSLRFLFLLNNSHFITKQFGYTSFLSESYKEALIGKVEGYMESYIQVFWAPVLSCLLDPTPLCFGRSYSPLPKFESEFQKTYSTQKLWKVPDPNIRKRLRQAVTKKLIPGYTEYIKDNDIVSPKITPQELEGMLQDLFEG